jgi:acyl-CoA synthetase (AMP-forming)/AMP-acid ligase II
MSCVFGMTNTRYSEWISPLIFARRLSAMTSASRQRFAFSGSAMSQPTILRAFRSIATAKENQPSAVQTYAMSVVHFSFGPDAR